MNKNHKLNRTAAVGMAAAMTLSALAVSGTPVYAADKSIADVAVDVIRGDYGNNPERAEKLTADGYDAAAVQAEVNRILGVTPVATESVTDVAWRVIRGDYGNNPDRVEKLTAAGYDAAAVQAEVNRILLGGSSSDEDQTGSGSEGTERGTSEAEESGNAGSTEIPAVGSVHDAALAVIHGEYGNNPERAERLAADGYDAAAVQAEVNRILRGEASESPSGSGSTTGGSESAAGGSDQTSGGQETTGSGSTTGGSSTETPSGGSGSESGAAEEVHDWVPETQEIQHDAEYKTIHHDAVTHVEHHDAYDETVVDTPAWDETVVDKPAVTHVEHHDAVTHEETVPATYKTVHHDATYKTVHHEAVTHTEEVPSRTYYDVTLPIVEGATAKGLCWPGSVDMEPTPDKYATSNIYAIMEYGHLMMQHMKHGRIH